MVHISLCDGSPLTSTFRVHLHGHDRITILVKLILCFCHHFTLQRSTSVRTCGADGIEHKDFTCWIIRLHTPFEREVCRENLLSYIRVEKAVDLCSIKCLSITYSTSARCARRLQHGEERILFLGLFSSLVGNGSLFTLVHLSQHTGGVLAGISLFCYRFCLSHSRSVSLN